MPRRKQTCPKRMKLTEGEEGANSTEKEDASNTDPERTDNCDRDDSDHLSSDDEASEKSKVPVEKESNAATVENGKEFSDSITNPEELKGKKSELETLCEKMKEYEPVKVPYIPILQEDENLKNIENLVKKMTKSADREKRHHHHHHHHHHSHHHSRSHFFNEKEKTHHEKKEEKVDSLSWKSRLLANYQCTENQIQPQTDEPLDLSKKPKERSHLKRQHVDSDMVKTSVTVPSESNSLSDLEKKFGNSNTSVLESVGNPISAFLPKPAIQKQPLMPTFGGSLFASTLFNTTPLMIPVERPLAKNRQDRKLLPPSVSTSVFQPLPSVGRSSQSPAKYIPPPESTPHLSKDDFHKHTNFKCVCGKEYESLYELTMHMQETGHPANNGKYHKSDYPKLVRGQDMWLNQGSEQTKQILRCMQCGDSFKSLPELTIHMMETRHYTNIVGPDSKKNGQKSPGLYEKYIDEFEENIFTCKVCKLTFPDMDGLATHMVTSGHHRKTNNEGHSKVSVKEEHAPFKKEHFQRRAERKMSASGNEYRNSSFELPLKRNCPPRKRKISTDRSSEVSDVSASGSEELESSRITCENCGEKIDTHAFVEHVRVCVKIQSKILDTAKIMPSLDNIYKDQIKVRKLEPLTVKVKVEYTSKMALQNGNMDVFKKSPDMPKMSLSSNKMVTPSSRSSTPHSDRGLTPSPMRSRSHSRSRTPSRSETPIGTPCHRLSQEPMLPDSVAASEGSALKAMESFIERSFMPPTTSKRTKTCSNLDSQYPDTTAPNLDHVHHKYLNPDSPAQIHTIKTENNCVKIEVRKESSESERPHSAQSRPDSQSDPLHSSESPKPLQLKYLQEEDSKFENAKGSALQSLQGLVYGQSLSSEHPLDSLQKLIHSTNKTSPQGTNGSQTVVSGAATLTSGLPGTVVLVNPIVTVVPASNSSVQSLVQIKISNNSPESASEDGPDDKKSDQQDDSDPDSNLLYSCHACSRTFASKGSYRYHLSRCHLSSVKRYGIKEAFNMSPYVYLPLDHSAKFTKYYQMANELANKGK